jgi:hypothetical protein
MLQAKTPSFPSVINVDSNFDIYKKLPDGNFICIGRVRGLGEAEKRISRLTQKDTGDYMIHSQGLVF